MVQNIIQRAVGLGRRAGRLLVATADGDGWPHVASAGRIRLAQNRYVEVAAWFCPGTVANLEVNRRVALLVWEPASDSGYQLVGEVEHVDDSAMLDGYDPAVERETPLPQTERTLRVRVDKVLAFSQAPHSDIEEKEEK